MTKPKFCMNCHKSRPAEDFPAIKGYSKRACKICTAKAKAVKVKASKANQRALRNIERGTYVDRVPK